MKKHLFTRRRAVAIATAALAVTGMSTAFSGVAGATGTELTGSGSNTTYSMMVQLGDLFSTAPGCDLTASGALYKTMSCGTSPQSPTLLVTPSTPSGAAGENGYAESFENPYDDFVANAPAVGSGNGVNQLNDTTSGDFAPSFGRSSGAPGSSNGTAAQNYVAYAMDGVDWTAFTGMEGGAYSDGTPVGGTLKRPVALPASYVPFITNSEIQEIWAGTLGDSGCSIGTGSHLTALAPMTWGCLFPSVGNPKAAELTAAETPIDCYVAQPGSGTAGTWATFAGYDKKNATPIGCLDHEGGDSKDGDSAQTAAAPVTGTVSNVTYAAKVVTVTVSAPWSSTPTANQAVQLSGVSGVTNVNGTWLVTSATSNSVTFSVNTAPTGAYTSGGSVTIASGTTTAAASADHYNLFENEMASTMAQNDQASAIYFFSYGKFVTTCSVATTKGARVCLGTQSPTVTSDSITSGGIQYETSLGHMLSSLDGTTVLSPDQSDIQGTGGGVYTSATGEWPVNRYLYNVYNNTSTGTDGVVTAATLNFASEYGFLCKPATALDYDPLSTNPLGATYRTEIEADILAQGFFPIDVSGAPFSEGTFTTNKASLLSGDAEYSIVDPTADGTIVGDGTAATFGVPSGQTSTVSDPVGYCLNING